MAKQKGSQVALPVVLAIILTLTACGPTIQKITVSPSTLLPGEEAEIKVIARNPKRGVLAYLWEARKGQVPSGVTTDTVSYTAPDETGVDRVTVTVDDGSKTTTKDIEIPVVEPKTIRLDAMGIPAGWMTAPDVDPELIIDLAGGQPTGTCYTGVDCLRIAYRSGGIWGGIYWWPMHCGPGGDEETWDRVKRNECGINVSEIGDISEMKRLTFWARGERGNEVIEFKIGGIDISPKPGRSLGKIALTPDWEQYRMDLRGMDLTDAVGLFAWIAADLDNSRGAVFYLDDIQFEGLKKE